MGGNIVQLFYFSYISCLWLYLRDSHSALSLPEVLPSTLADTAYAFGVAGVTGITAWGTGLFGASTTSGITWVATIGREGGWEAELRFEVPLLHLCFWSSQELPSWMMVSWSHGCFQGQSRGPHWCIARRLGSSVSPLLLLPGSLRLQAEPPRLVSWGHRDCLRSFFSSASSVCSSLLTFRCTDVEISDILVSWAEGLLLSYGCFTGYRLKGRDEGMLTWCWHHSFLNLLASSKAFMVSSFHLL